MVRLPNTESESLTIASTLQQVPSCSQDSFVIGGSRPQMRVHGPKWPQGHILSGSHARRAFSSYSSLDLEPFGSRTLIVANSLTKTHPECCNFRICSLVSSLPVRMKFHLMAFLPHARSPIAPTVFRLLCHTPTQSLTSWCSMDRRLGFPTSRSGLVRSLVHLEGPSRHFIRK